MHVTYDGSRHPRSAEFDFGKGANCQLWAYALLKHFGIDAPPFRSRGLWDDGEFSATVQQFEPLDLLLFNDSENAWGAHVAVYLGDGTVAHLSKQNGLPQICTVGDMLRNPKYRVLIGGKLITARR